MKQSIFAMIADDIKQQILDQKIKVGGMMPSENALCATYNVTRTTIRRAMALLIKENYITPITGKGYTVNEPSLNNFLLQFDEHSGFTCSPIESQLIKVDIINPTPEQMVKLHMWENKRVVNIKRMYLYEEKPVGFDDKYIIYYTGMPLIETEIHYPSIFSKNTSGKDLRGELSISAQNANAYIASLFTEHSGVPVTVVEQIIKDPEGSVLGYAQTYYLAEYFEIEAKSFS
ncbi:MAG: GntR family transcriptional regulator [Eubacteriales bacterium]